jgi:CheY-like chemotaxis protein
VAALIVVAAPSRVKHVLLLEDMPILAKMNSDILNKNGFATDITTNSDDAWVKLGEGKFYHCIILDVMVPGSMNGIELCERLRKDKRFDKAAVVILTANASPQIEESARAAGCDAFFCKPYKIMQLLEVVRALASVREDSASSPSS